MTRVAWDNVGERRYETGIDRGVLYHHDGSGDYNTGFPWNGLTGVTESPSGAESNKQYADNGVYVNLLSAEEFGGTIEAFTFPLEFAECDGTKIVGGVTIGQQGRKTFGLCYRTRVGNDVDGTDHGYKLHLVYGALASPSEKGYETINDSPEAMGFSWEFTTTPVAVPGFKPTALVTVDSTVVDPDQLVTLEDALYGDNDSGPRLPLPEEVLSILGVSDAAEVRLTGVNSPTYNAGTHVITLPAVTGVQWLVDGEEVTSGAQPALAVGDSVEVSARPEDSYTITSDQDWTFDY